MSARARGLACTEGWGLTGGQAYKSAWNKPVAVSGGADRFRSVSEHVECLTEGPQCEPQQYRQPRSIVGSDTEQL